MAANDPVVIIHRDLPPAANAAALISLAGGSTPAEGIVGYAFDASTVQHMDFLCELWGYDDGGLTWRLKWGAETATSGLCDWVASLRRVEDDNHVLTASKNYSTNEQSTAATAPTVLNEVSYDTITMTHGLQMDSVADGDMFILRISRDADDGTNDTMAGDAHLWSVLGVES